MPAKGHLSASQRLKRLSSKPILLLLIAAAICLLWPVLPARAEVQVQVVGGLLSAVLSDSGKVEITCVNNLVYVNDLSPDTGAAECDSIIGVAVRGSAKNDVLDLSRLNPSDFPALERVVVNAGAGNDTIYASELSEVLDGSLGDDTYVGVDKRDQVNTDLGQDYFLQATLPLDFADLSAAINPQDQVLQPDAPELETSVEGIDFDADRGLTGVYQIPPDPIGAAGPAHVVSVVNSSIQWFTKGGTLQNSQRLGSDGTTHVGSFFEVLAPVNRLYDPKVIYDQFAGRFLVVALERQDDRLGDPVDSSRILLAVSDDSDPNGSWYFLAINSRVRIGLDYTWADYPGFAIDEEVVYVTSNMFTYADTMGNRYYRGSRLWIVNKQPFYGGGSAPVPFYDPSTAAGVAATTMQPAHIFGPAQDSVGTWLVRSGFSGAGQEFLSLIRVDNPLGTPIFSHSYVLLGDVDNTVINPIPTAPQLGTTATIATNDRRALHAVWRDDSLWATFQVVPVSGADAGQVTAHWTQVDTSNLAVPALVDQGDAGGEDIAPGTFTFFPSIAVDQCGNMGLGFAASAPSIYPGAYYSARSASDPAGSLQPSEALAVGLDFYYRTFAGTSNRWGDYSGIALDPTGEAAFWVYNEYALTRGTILPDYPTQDGRWGTRWGSFLSGIDFGDLPAEYSQTLNSDGGARHCLSALSLGSSVNADADGQESAAAQGDSDDGVVAAGNWSDGSGDLLVEVAGGPACLSAWLDYWDGTTFGADNDFADPGEQIFDRQPLGAGVTPLSFALPAGAASGNPSPTFFARFRLVPDLDGDGVCSDQAALSATGLESGGEVEDYRFTFTPTAVRIEDFQASTVSGGLLNRVITFLWLGIVGLLSFYFLRYLTARKRLLQ